MAKCSKCGKEIPNTGKESPNWKLYCKKCGDEEMKKMFVKKKGMCLSACEVGRHFPSFWGCWVGYGGVSKTLLLESLGSYSARRPTA